jgi:hypothetical protein
LLGLVLYQKLLEGEHYNIKERKPRQMHAKKRAYGGYTIVGRNV